MEHECNNLPALKTFWMYLKEGLKRSHARRPVSFYLLLAMPVVLLLGANITQSMDSPKRFVFYLSALFVFFLVVLHRALVDFMEIARDHFHESERVYKTTLGDREFVDQLRTGIEKRRSDDL